MVYTRHGHHIPGSDEELFPSSKVYRCGGPGLCAACSNDAGIFNESRSLRIAKIKADATGYEGHTLVTTAQRYTTKPMDIVAIQFTGGDGLGFDITKWVNDNGGKATYRSSQDPEQFPDGTSHDGWPEVITIENDIGYVEAVNGYWIFQEANGVFRVCSPDEFTEKYTPKE